MLIFIFLLIFSLPHFAVADCAGPVGKAGQFQFFTGDSKFKICDGVSWINFAIGYNSASCGTIPEGKLVYNLATKYYQLCLGPWLYDVGPLSSTDGTCSAALNGAIYWDVAKVNLRWCNGVNWRPIH